MNYILRGSKYLIISLSFLFTYIKAYFITLLIYICPELLVFIFPKLPKITSLFGVVDIKESSPNIS